MYQSAIFVDAGYFYAQGSQLLAGSRQPREACSLLIDGLGATLTGLAASLADTRLLRTYWYDGLIRGGVLTAEQTALSRMNSLKLRLGMVNSRGEQKGVDSLIVIDLIELARNHAISDAFIISGDEDIRVGVQLAQTFGVRVHLVGIKPAFGSQSLDLITEADTHVEWSDVDLATCLKIRAHANPVHKAVLNVKEPIVDDFDEAAKTLVERTLAMLNAVDRDGVRAYINANKGALPANVDRPALAGLRDLIGRDLTPDERKQFRASLRQELRREVHGL